MKIRNGFVSNSSSSSFLIIFKKVDVFDKFKCFNGYEKFIDDLSSYSWNNAKDFFEYSLRSSFDDEIYFLKEDDLFYSQFDKYDASCLKSSIESILQKKIDESKFKNIFELSRKICEKKGELKLSGMKNWEITASLQKSFRDDINKECKEVSKIFIEELEKSDFDFHVIDYADDSEFGSYMEHEFMPMISMNADNDEFLIITKSNH